MLLFWSEDVGINGQSLAAVRFPKPVVTSSLRIVPHGTAPFASIPSTLGQTQPDAFPLRVYFNVVHSTVQQSQSADRQRPSNSLIPIDIEYSGKLVELSLENEAITTRLIIFDGKFDKLSVAIYGTPVTESHHAPNSSESVLPPYHPSPLPHTSAPELPLYARVAEASRPSSLAEKLIAERHGYLFDLILRQLTSPSCAHSTGNGMEIGSCPTKLAECVISEVSDLEWLGMAVDVSSLPTLSHVPAEVDKFLARIEASFDSLKEFLDIDLGDYYFRILRNLSRQPDYVLLPFLQSSLLHTFLASPIPQPSSMQLLLDSVANPHVAQSMREECAFCLDQIDANPALSRQIYDIALRIKQRSEGWALYEKFLTSQQNSSDSGDSNADPLITWVKDMVQDDEAIPVFLLSLLDSSYAPKANTSSLILLFSDIKVSRSVVPTIYTWLRAWVGITSTVITLGWACMNLDYDLVSILGRLSMLWHRSEYREIIELGCSSELVKRHVHACYDDSDTPQDVHDILGKILTLPYPSLQTTISPSHDEVLHAMQAAVHALKFLEDGGNVIGEDTPMIITLYRSITVIARWLVSASFSATLLSRLPSSLTYILTRSGQLAVSVMLARNSPFQSPLSISELTSIKLEMLATLALISLQSLDTTIAKAPLVPVISKAVARLVVETLCLSWLSLNASSSIIKSAHLEWACLCLVRDTLQAGGNNGSTSPNLISDILEFSLNHPMTIAHVIEVTSAFLLRLLDETDHGHIPGSTLNYEFTMAAPMIWEFLARTSPPARASMIRSIQASLLLDLGDWLIEQQVSSIQTAAHALSHMIRGEARKDLLIAHVDMGLTCLHLLMETPCFFGDVMEEKLASALSDTLLGLYEAGAQLSSAQNVCVLLCKTMTMPDGNLPAAVALTTLRGCCGISPVASSVEIIHHSRVALESSNGADNEGVAASILIELGQLISLLILEGGLQQLPTTIAEDVVALIQWCTKNHPVTSSSFEGSHEHFLAFVSWLADVLPAEKLPVLDTISANHLPLTASAIPMPPFHTHAPLLGISINELKYALDPTCPSLPSTPDGKDQPSIDNPGIVANLVSPPILRSPAINMGSLPKRYSNNDFRQIRPASSTSRPPSTHVDEFTANGLASPLLDF